jgi:hypothetical protein
MIIKPRKQFQKRTVIIFTVLVGLCLVGSVGVYAFMKTRPAPATGDKKHPTTTISKPTDRLNVQPEEENPGAHQHGIIGTETSDESAGAAAFPTSQPNLVVEITQTNKSGSQLVITTAISPKAEGSCTVELTRTGQNSITKTFALESANGGSQCQNGRLDVSLAASGEWTLTIKVQVGNNVATATKSVTL